MNPVRISASGPNRSARNPDAIIATSRQASATVCCDVASASVYRPVCPANSGRYTDPK